MKINLRGIFQSTGYGVFTFNLLKELANITDVSLWPIGPIEWECEEIKRLTPLIGKCQANSQFFDPASPSLTVYHQFDMGQSVGRGPRWGYTFFEIDRLMPNEVHHLNTLDRLFLPSQFYKDVATSNGVTVPISVVHPGVDTLIFDKTQTVNRGELRAAGLPIADDDYVFFHSGKAEIRKSTYKIPQWFKLAFPTEPNVKLIAHIYNPCLSPEENKQWLRLYEGDPRLITFKGRMGSQRDIARLMAASDCGLFPSRAEGWNLELAEMLAMDKVAIATDYSSHTEFINENCLKIPILERESAYDGRWFHGYGQWAKIGEAEESAIVTLMREAYNKRMVGKPTDFAKQFTWRATAEDIIKERL